MKRKYEKKIKKKKDNQEHERNGKLKKYDEKDTREKNNEQSQKIITNLVNKEKKKESKKRNTKTKTSLREGMTKSLHLRIKKYGNLY